MTPIPSIRRWRQPIKFLVGLGLLLWLFTLVDTERLLSSMRSANPGLLLWGFIFSSLQGVFEGARLRIVFSSFQIRFVDGLKLFLIGMFFGNFMPGPMGPAVYQIYHMHSIRAGLLTPISLTLFLRANGLLLNCLLAVVASLLASRSWLDSVELHLPIGTIVTWIIPSLVGALVVLIVLASLSWGRTRLKLLQRKALDWSRQFIGVVRSFSASQHLGISALGILVILSRTASLFVLVWAFGSSIPMADALLVVTLTTLVLILPLSFAGLGVREVSITALLVSLGLDPPAALAVSLTGRVYIWLLSMIGGVWFMAARSGSKSGP